MVIAINIRILSGDEAASKILLNSFENMAAENSAHQFYFISNKAIPLSSQGNVNTIVIPQQTSSTLLWKLWYNYKLPAALKKIKASLLISADGIGSLRTNLPQCIIVNDLAFFDHPEWYSKRYVNFAKTSLPPGLNKAAGIICFSAQVKNEIITRFGIEERKIIIASSFNHSKYQPISWEEKETVKNKYSGGNEYFLFRGAIHNRQHLTNLLKAFSLFKKRQKSAMQLLLVTGGIQVKNAFVESLRLYKYRNDLHLLTGLTEEEIIPITASAWCAIGLSPLYSDIQVLQKSVLAGVAVIACDTAQAKWLLKDAALYASASSIDSIAEQLMIIYKDEKRQSGLVESGRRLHQEQTRDTHETWKMILSLTNTR